MISDDRYYYKSDFANGFYGIQFCGTAVSAPTNRHNRWYIGIHSPKPKCRGYAYNDNTDKCVNNIGFDWKYANVTVWADARDGLSVKCLYEHGDCCADVLL